MSNYGKELIIDIHNCKARFIRKSIKSFLTQLCIEIDMKAEKLVWWDDVGVAKELKQTEAHTKGTTAVQFILTSNVTIHTLDIPKSVYINIFSCKDFDVDNALEFCEDFWRGEIVNSQVVDRI